MQLSGAPTKVTVPFANSGTKNTIPTASQIGVTPGAASYTDGFPPLTFTPLASGGVPPAGADFNGILNAITQAVRWQMAGGMFTYDSSFSTAVGGYPKGAVLLNSAANSLWINQIDNNTANPDTGGANWNSLSLGRLLRTSVYYNGGTQLVIVDGGTSTSVGATTFTALATTTKIRARGVGGGGGGGGTQATGSSQISIGAGASAGGYGEGIYTSGFTGGIAVSCGSGGIANSGATGGNGGTTSLGSLLSIPGGVGGIVGGVTTNTGSSFNPGASSGTVGSGGSTVNTSGQYGGDGIYIVGVIPQGGKGGSTPFGVGGFHNGYGAGTPGNGWGAGGSGACANVSTGAQPGGGGTGGFLIVEEYA